MMKSLMSKLLGLTLCSLAVAPLAANGWGQNYSNCNNCCEWSCCDGKFVVGADWLYWKTEQDCAVGTIVKFEEFDNEFEGIAVKGDVKTWNQKYDNGFRVYAGYELPCDCWDIGVAYTYMPTNAKIRSFESDDPFSSLGDVFVTDITDLQAIALEREELQEFDFFSAKWNNNINWIDVDLGRTICLCECFKFRPHAGFRAAWMDQKFRSFAVQSLGQYENTSFATRIKQTFNGYGLQGGLWGEWELGGCGLSVIGHVGGSLMAAKFKIEEKSIITEQSSVDSFFLHPILGHDSFWTATPTFDYFLGLRYEDCFCDMSFSAHIGWEQHLFFNMNRLFDDCGNGNLSTQGLTLGLDVGF